MRRRELLASIACLALRKASVVSHSQPAATCQPRVQGCALALPSLSRTTVRLMSHVPHGTVMKWVLDTQSDAAEATAAEMDAAQQNLVSTMADTTSGASTPRGATPGPSSTDPNTPAASTPAAVSASGTAQQPKSLQAAAVTAAAAAVANERQPHPLSQATTPAPASTTTTGASTPAAPNMSASPSLQSTNAATAMDLDPKPDDAGNAPEAVAADEKLLPSASNPAKGGEQGGTIESATQAVREAGDPDKLIDQAPGTQTFVEDEQQLASEAMVGMEGSEQAP